MYLQVQLKLSITCPTMQNFIRNICITITMQSDTSVSLGSKKYRIVSLTASGPKIIYDPCLQ